MSALMNTGVVLALRACQRHRPAPRSYPDDRRPQRPDALALGRTDTTIASASSTWTSSATLRANSQTRCHTLLFCTLFLRPLLSRLWTARNLGTHGVQPPQPSPTHPQIQQESDIWAATTGVQGRLPTRLSRTLTAQPGRATPTTSCPPAGYGRCGSLVEIGPVSS